MKQLPTGVYVVANLITSDGLIRYRGEIYQCQPGVTGFHCLEDLAAQTLVPVEEPFMGYENVSVVLMPAGHYPIGERGKTNAERFRTVFTSPVAILGENAGLDANHHEDIFLVNDERSRETVIQGSFYFGAIAMTGETDGALILDGLTLGCRVQDLRTGGKNVSLEVHCCILTANISGNIIHVADNFVGERYTEITFCRAADILSMNGEGNIFYIGSGDGYMADIYVANTDKLVGMSNRACTVPTHLRSLRICALWVENCTGDHCLNFYLPDEGQNLVIDHGAFENAVPPDMPIFRIRHNPKSKVTLTSNDIYNIDKTFLGLVDTFDNFLNTSFVPHWNGLHFFKEFPARRTVAALSPDRSCADAHACLQGPDFSALDRLYEGRQCFHGDFHCHSNSGGTSDGKTPLADYVPGMDALAMDFAAIVDHRQMRHFFLPEWDDARLICGTEPGCMLTDGDRPWYERKLDYTMIFPDKTGLARVMEAFPQFKYTGGTEGTYVYAPHTREELRQLGEYVYSIGGLLSHAHPKQLMVSADPLDYYFGDHVAIETIHGNPGNYATELNHRLWTQLLNLGKQVRTHGSTDSHGPVSNKGLTTVFCEKRNAADIFRLVRAGDCTAGAVGIKMSIDDAPMGSVTDYKPGKTLYVKTGPFHRDHRPADTVYSLRVYTDRGLAWKQEFTDVNGEQALALPIQPRKFYRVEIYNESDNHIVALSNPIWLTMDN